MWRPPTHLPRGMFYQYCMWGVQPIAFTYIPLMPAGDVASGAESSKCLGPVSTEGTVPGAAHFSLRWKRRCAFLSVTKNIYTTLSEEKGNQHFKATCHLHLTLLACAVTTGQVSRWKQIHLVFQNLGVHESAAVISKLLK